MSSPPNPEFSAEQADLTHGSYLVFGLGFAQSLRRALILPAADVGSSDDILIEDMKSGLRAIQAVTEQLSVEEESTTLIQLILMVETTVKTLSRRPTAYKKIGRMPRSPHKEAKTTLTILNDTLRNVQELHIATIQRQVKRSVVTARPCFSIT